MAPPSRPEHSLRTSQRSCDARRHVTRTHAKGDSQPPDTYHSGWSAAYSLQFEIGPLSEASIGNVGMRPETTGWVDDVVTPLGAFGLIVAEDALDRYFVQWRNDASTIRCCVFPAIRGESWPHARKYGEWSCAVTSQRTSLDMAMTAARCESSGELERVPVFREHLQT